MKATAIAPANIAFIKYWGKTDDMFRLPSNPSISMNLSEAYTTTTVEFSESLVKDTIRFVSQNEFTNQPRPLVTNEWQNEKENMRIIRHIDRIRPLKGSALKAKVVTKNSFPKSAGVASSASGFAALTVAAVKALGLDVSERELTVLARTGSGSACRSIPDGFVFWEKGERSEESYAYSLYQHTYWDLRDILVIVDSGNKKVSTAEGMGAALTSPFFQARLKAIPERIYKVKIALQKRDISRLGSVIEEDCLDMHHVMQTQNPPLFYWNETTKIIMRAVKNWRKNGITVYFTIDAGPNVHLICESTDERVVLDKIRTLTGIERVIINKPAQGAHIVQNHLF